MTSSPELAKQIVADLAKSGVTDVVYCPGSRNAPLALAFAESSLRVHSRIDERSASFTALGMARVAGRPVPVVTTSGTAVANCLPAMVEAYYSATPFVVLSADRPERYVGKGASQTIVQKNLFEPYAPTVSSVGEALEYQQVHINVPFDVPLVGPAESPEATVGTWERPGVEKREVSIDISKNTLVIAGDGAKEIPGLEDVPTLAEPTVPAPYHPVHPLAAAMFDQLDKPEQIVVVGHPTLHRDVMKLTNEVPKIVVKQPGEHYVTDPEDTAQEIATELKVTGQPRDEWLKILDAASELGAESVREQLEQFTGLTVAAAVADSLYQTNALFVGASNPIRDIHLAGLPFEGVDTYSPRGAAGIDGSVSQAIGVALAHQSSDPTAPTAPRTVALLGDVTFLHDVGGLLIVDGSSRPENLTIVVANDNGGGIFETLEQGAPEYRDAFEPFFGTPHTDVDIAHIAEAYGIEYTKVVDLPSLQEELEREPTGIRIIEAVTDRDNLRDIHASMRARMHV